MIGDSLVWIFEWFKVVKYVVRFGYLVNLFKYDEKDFDFKCFELYDCRIWKNLEIFEEVEKFIIKNNVERIV